VRDQGDVYIVICAGVQELNFTATSAFFTRGAYEFDGTREGVLGEDVSGCEGCGDGGGRDEVVTAGVAYVWEGVLEL
jgi:hypothetical protein